MLTKNKHLTFQVNDFEKAIEWYKGYLNRAPLYKDHIWAVFDRDDDKIYLVNALLIDQIDMAKNYVQKAFPEGVLSTSLKNNASGQTSKKSKNKNRNEDDLVENLSIDSDIEYFQVTIH